MKKVALFWCVVAVAGLAYWWWVDSTNQANRAAEFQRIERELAASIAALARETNAVDDWDKKLRGKDSYRLDPVLTIELERLWLTGRPILFRGSLADIKTADASDYQVTLTAGLDSRYNLATKLHLSLRCEKAAINALLAAHPTITKDASFNDSLVVIARIVAMRTERISAGADETEDIRIGEGTCVRLFFVGNR